MGILPLKIMKYLILIIFFTVFTNQILAKPSLKHETIKINNISINKQTSEIQIKASFAVKHDILEYFLVGEEGKAYESAFKVDSKTKGSELNFALLLIGSEPVPFAELMKYQKMTNGLQQLKHKYPNSIFNINLYLYDTQLSPALFLRNREIKDYQNKNLTWVYTGGCFSTNNKYMADIDFCYIGIWPDSSAPLNLFNTGQNPYQNENAGFIMTHPSDIDISIDQKILIIIKKSKE